MEGMEIRTYRGDETMPQKHYKSPGVRTCSVTDNDEVNTDSICADSRTESS